MNADLMIFTILGAIASLVWDGIAWIRWIACSKELKRAGYGLVDRWTDPEYRELLRHAVTDAVYGFVTAQVIAFLYTPLLAACIGPWIGIALSRWQSRQAHLTAKHEAARALALERGEYVPTKAEVRAARRAARLRKLGGPGPARGVS